MAVSTAGNHSEGKANNINYFSKQKQVCTKQINPWIFKSRQYLHHNYIVSILMTIYFFLPEGRWKEPFTKEGGAVGREMGEQVHNLKELQALITQFIPSKFLFVKTINVYTLQGPRGRTAPTLPS